MIDSDKKNSGRVNAKANKNEAADNNETAENTECGPQPACGNEAMNKEGNSTSAPAENGNGAKSEIAETEDKNYPFMKKSQIKKTRAVLYVILFIAAILLIVFRDKL